MNRITVSVIVFVFCCIVIGYLFLNIGSFKIFGDIPEAILLGGLFSYVGIFLTYIVMVRGFDKLKHHFYGVPLGAIRDVIDGKTGFVKDFVSLYLLSGVVNFFSLYFLYITPIKSLLNRIPGFENFQSIENLDGVIIFDPLVLSRLGGVEYILPFMCVGLTIIFVLRYLRRREDNQSENKYPGSRPLLAFLYPMFFIIYYHIISMNEIEGASVIRSQFEFAILVIFVLSLFSVFAVFVVVILDRILLPKKKKLDNLRYYFLNRCDSR